MIWTITTAVITSAITTVVTIWVKSRVLGPKLIVVLRDDEYGSMKTIEQLQCGVTVSHQPTDQGLPIVQQLAPEIRSEVLYLRLRVQNTGYETAKQCRAFLTDVEFESGGRYSRVFWDCIPLCWSYLDRSEPQVLDLPNGIDMNVDLLSAHSRTETTELRPRTTSIPFRYESIFTQFGRYRLTIAVVAENAMAVKRRFLIEWKGRWDDLSPNECR